MKLCIFGDTSNFLHQIFLLVIANVVLATVSFVKFFLILFVVENLNMLYGIFGVTGKLGMPEQQYFHECIICTYLRIQKLTFKQ